MEFRQKYLQQNFDQRASLRLIKIYKAIIESLPLVKSSKVFSSTFMKESNVQANEEVSVIDGKDLDS